MKHSLVKIEIIANTEKESFIYKIAGNKNIPLSIITDGLEEILEKFNSILEKNQEATSEELILSQKSEIEIERYLIWDKHYVGNSLLFHRRNKQGYTSDIDMAHQFSYGEAVVFTRGNRHQLISLTYLKSIATYQINSEHLDREMLGKEVSNGL